MSRFREVEKKNRRERANYRVANWSKLFGGSSSSSLCLVFLCLLSPTHYLCRLVGERQCHLAGGVEHNNNGENDNEEEKDDDQTANRQFVIQPAKTVFRR